MNLHLFAGNSIRATLDALVPDFERQTGHVVAVTYEPAKIMLRRIAAGERADAVIMNGAGLDELIAAGTVDRASRREIARLQIGVAVRRRAPRPDIGTVAAFRETLLAAPTIACTGEGASGLHFAQVIERLGIAEPLRPKLRTRPGGLIAELLLTGEAELAIQQIPELLAVPGVDVIGPLPAEVQKTGINIAGVFAGSQAKDAASALLAHLTTARAAQVLREKGLDPAF